jgi:hypothetical protein
VNVASALVSPRASVGSKSTIGLVVTTPSEAVGELEQLLELARTRAASARLLVSKPIPLSAVKVIAEPHKRLAVPVSTDGRTMERKRTINNKSEGIVETTERQTTRQQQKQ